MTDDRFVYLDTETTGLDPQHEVWEMAYAVNDDPIQTARVSHSAHTADIQALVISRYFERGGSQLTDGLHFELELKQILAGATIIGANPAFDAAKLLARWGVAPWHYRLYDIETYAMPAFGTKKPLGLARIAEALNVSAPDHSAAGDVHTLRECHRALKAFYAHHLVPLALPA